MRRKLLWVRKRARKIDRLLSGIGTYSYGKDPSKCGVAIAKAMIKMGCADEFLRRLRKEVRDA